MSKPHHREHSNSATLSAVCTVMPGYRSVAFVRRRLGQAQNGRFGHHKPETSAKFGDPWNEPPHVRMQDGELFLSSAWLSAAQSLSCLLGAAATPAPAPALIIDDVSSGGRPLAQDRGGR